jgi:hypothetical protein
MQEFVLLLLASALGLALPAPRAATNVVIGWNDLGMHCEDGVDYSVVGLAPELGLGGFAMPGTQRYYRLHRP